MSDYQIILAGQTCIKQPDGDDYYQINPALVEVWSAPQSEPTEDCDEECYTTWLNRNMDAIRAHITATWSQDWDKVVLLSSIFPDKEFYK